VWLAIGPRLRRKGILFREVSSVILLQVVGTLPKGPGPDARVVLSVAAGQFTAQGPAGVQFRYVVFN
jgi:hypothetical protein